MYSKSASDDFSDCGCDRNRNNLYNNMMNRMNRAANGEVKYGKDYNCNNNNKKPVKTIEVKKEEVLAIRNRFPTKVPVIVQRFYRETHLPVLDKSKFLVPQEITMSQFQTIIRNRVKLTSNQALYLLVNNRSMLSLSLSMAEIYTEHASSDGYLYVTYASQEVFGAVEDYKNKKNCKQNALNGDDEPVDL